MLSTTLRRGLAALGLGGLTAVAAGTLRLDRRTADRVDALRAAADGPVRPVDREEYAGLPDPVRDYFDAVIDDGRSRVGTARVEQRGEFRLGGRSGSWKPMRATQDYAVDPPGFLWDASVDVYPFVPVRVVDAYERGEGSLRARLLSVVPIAAAEPGPALDEGELLRYLAEAVWFPTALLPSAGVEWEPIDARTARATLGDRGNTASLRFSFDDEGVIERVTAEERYREEEDRYRPWTGSFGEYRWYDGLRIPTEATVAWVLPDGNLPYWRARITRVEYEP
ncbi:MAG: DUF6544 family protein [Halosimplex sp.]